MCLIGKASSDSTAGGHPAQLVPRHSVSETSSHLMIPTLACPTCDSPPTGPCGTSNIPSDVSQLTFITTTITHASLPIPPSLLQAKMCKTWSISYTCAHTSPFRLSTCGGHFTTQPKPDRSAKAACCSAPLFVLHSARLCGLCQRARAEKDVNEVVAELGSRDVMGFGHDGTEELVGGDIPDLDHAFWILKRTFPDKRYAKPPRPAADRARRTKGSILKREVRAEEVIVRYELNTAAVGDGWEWEGDWPSLGDEIAEATKEEQEEAWRGEDVSTSSEPVETPDLTGELDISLPTFADENSLPEEAAASETFCCTPGEETAFHLASQPILLPPHKGRSQIPAAAPRHESDADASAPDGDSNSGDTDLRQRFQCMRWQYLTVSVSP